MMMMRDMNTSSPASTDTIFTLPIPTVRIVEPTPIKSYEPVKQDPTPTRSPQSRPRRVMPSHRVLYRGSFSFSSAESAICLEGICFVAHFTPTSPTHSSLINSPLPLALESQRGRPALSIISVIPLASLDERLDDTIDVKMYINPQSLITRAYFERLFCTSEIERSDFRSTYGVRVRLGDLETDDVIIYGQLDPSSQTVTNASNSSKVLNMRTARILPPASSNRSLKPRPRPDDPLPRVPPFPLLPQKEIKRKRVPSFAPSENQARKFPRFDKALSKSTNGRSFSRSVSSVLPLTTSVGNPDRPLARAPMARTNSAMEPPRSRMNDSSLGVMEDDVFSASIAEASSLGAQYGRSRGLFGSAISPGIKEVTTEEDSLLRSNKDTIKKVVLSALVFRNILKEDERFKDIYQMTIRGVGFALRDVVNARRVEREEVKPLVQKHLDMYIII